MSQFANRHTARSILVSVLAMAATAGAASAQMPAASNGTAAQGKADVFRLVQDVEDNMTPETVKALLGYDVVASNRAPISVNKGHVDVSYDIRTPYDRSGLSPSLSYHETIDTTSHLRTGFTIIGEFTYGSKDGKPCMTVRAIDDAARFSGWTKVGTDEAFISHSVKYIKGRLHLMIDAAGGTGDGSHAVASPPADTDDSCVQRFFVGASVSS